MLGIINLIDSTERNNPNVRKSLHFKQQDISHAGKASFDKAF